MDEKQLGLLADDELLHITDLGKEYIDDTSLESKSWAAGAAGGVAGASGGAAGAAAAKN